MKAQIEDLTDQTFNDLTALKVSRHVPNKGYFWMWKCSCGVEIEARACNVKSGHMKSCGCRRHRGEEQPVPCQHCGEISYRVLPSGHYARTCHSCANKQSNDSRDATKVMLGAAKVRAKKTGVPFALRPEDITIPTHCPILGIPLERGSISERNNSPSIDKIIPELGYVPSNIAIISYRANRIKNNGSAEEHRLIADWMESQLSLTEASA